MMARHDIQSKMVEIEKALMRLSNDAQGNSDYWDAIVAAQVILNEAAYKRG